MEVKTVRARKEHVCELCMQKIVAGQTYVNIRSEYDDWMEFDSNEGYSPFQTFRRHEKCEEAYKILMEFFDEPECVAYFYMGGTRDGVYDFLYEKLYWESDHVEFRQEIGEEKYQKVLPLLLEMEIKPHTKPMGEASQ